MKYVATVRYGAMRYTARFYATLPGAKMDDMVIVRTDRGVEWGNVVSIPEQVDDGKVPDSMGELLRVATDEDRAKLAQIEAEDEPLAMKLCQRTIEEHKLPMKLARAEKLFGGNKAIFYFLADGRVDFRALVKDLAKEYQTRIQMVQIGVRDEARLLADYEHCGRQLCCRTFIKKLEPVSMKMAKSQKATLDPSKISGRCGRLMCCLRFEDKMYDELKRSLPRKGTRVRVTDGTGDVVSFDILQQTVKVDLDGERRSVVVPVDAILERLSGSRQSSRGKAGADRDQQGRETKPTGGKPRRSRRGKRTADPARHRQRSEEAAPDGEDPERDTSAPGEAPGGAATDDSADRQT